MKRESVLKKVFQLLSRRQIRKFYVLMTFLFFGMLLEAFGIGIILPVLNVIISPENLKEYTWLNDLLGAFNITDQKQIITLTLGAMIFIYFFKSVYLVGLSYYQNRYISFISSEISNRLFKNYLNQDFMFHNNRNSAELIKILQVEIGMVMQLLLSGIILITEIAIAIAIVATLLIVEPMGTLFIIVFFFVFGSIYYFFSKKKSAAWGIIRQQVDNKIAKLITEGFNGFSEIYLLGRKHFFQNRLIDYNKTKARVLSNQVTLGQIPRYYLEFISVVSLVGFIFLMISNNKDANEIISVGGVFIAATFRVLPSINRIIGSLQQIKYYKSSVDVVNRDMKLKGHPEEDVSNTEEIFFSEKLELEAITFAYSKVDANVFEGLDFKLNKGEVVGIVGPSGVGKSTLVNVLVGFIHSYQGNFKVDGKLIDYSNSAQWRKQLGYVPQSIYLTDDSIRANIAFGEEPHEIDHQRMENAIKKAQLYTFIQSLPNQLDTIVGERGAQLSGGQRQRIGIARALYHEPKLLILDEATSALDEDTEKYVMKAVEGLKGEMTILIITHRLSTLAFCDKTYKVDQKKLVKYTSD